MLAGDETQLTGTESEASHSKAELVSLPSSQTQPVKHTQKISSRSHTDSPASASSDLTLSAHTGSVLRHPPVSAIHQGGSWQRVPQGGAERTPGQR